MKHADTTSNVDETAAGEASQGIGQLLRQTRERTGQEIGEVARALRIGKRYLEALEDGRNQDLPGTAYAIGFVRSYAEYLKLDGEEIVRRYKAEAQGVGVKADLIFPKPIPDSGVPGAAVLGLGVVVAAVAYGVWYWNSNADDMTVVRVEPVPEHMVAPSTEPATETAQPAPEPESEAALAQASEQAAEEAVGQAPVETPAEAVQEVSEAVAPAAEAVAAAEPTPEPTPEVTPEPTPEPAPEPVAQPEPAPAAVAAPPATETPTTEAPAAETPVAETPAAEAPAAAAPAVEAATPAPAAEVAAATPTAEDGVSRITVRAKSNSWIQVRDEALDRLLFTRLLREGDTYEVPDRSGLRLMTGNAGALELLVDGIAVPAIGEVGEVRRNVELDPEKLKAGTAVTE